MADNITLGVADYLASKDGPLGPKLKDSLLYGVQQQPDVQARMRRYARELNVPLPAALDDHQHVSTIGAVQDLDPNGMVLGSPKTATWLAEPDNAAVAHDDVSLLQQLEKGAKHLGQLGKASALGFAAGGLGYLQAAAPFLRQLGIEDPVGAGEFDDENSPMGKNIAMLRKAFKKASDEAMPKSESVVMRGVDAGIVSLAQNAPILAAAVATKNPAIAYGGAGAITGGNAYGDARDMGLSPTRSRVYAGIQGGIEIATEKLPMEALVGDVLKKSGLAQTVMHQLITEVPGEQVATAAQDFTEWAMLHPDKPFSDYLASRPDAALTTLIATGVGVAGNVSLAGTTDAIARKMNRDQPQAEASAQAEASTQAVADIVKLAETSKLRERDPQTFEQFMAAATEGEPVEHVYVPAQVLVDQLAEGSPEQLAQTAAVLQAMPSVAPQLDEAVTSGGLVQIPVSEFAAYAAGTPLAQSLLPHLKTDPNGFSMEEAQAFMQTQAETFKEEVRQALADKATVDQFEQSAQAVHETVKGMLQTANRFTADVNEAYATLVSSFYATQAARLNVTPQELFDRYPLKVQAAGVLDGSLTQGEASAKAITGVFDLSTPGGGPRDVKIGDTSISYGYDGKSVELISLRTPASKRNKGSARTAMQTMLAETDAKSIPVELLSSPLDKKTKDAKLFNFYKSLGFEPTGKKGNALGDPWMRREPVTDLAQGNKNAAPITETPAFKRWFGDSKVVDADGNPLVVYHGTGADIREFEAHRIGASTDSGKLGEGFYFSADPRISSFYADRSKPSRDAGPNVVPVYLSIQNPLVFEAKLRGPDLWSQLREQSAQFGIGEDPVTEREGNTPNPEWSRQFTDKAKAAGYDGVVLAFPDGRNEYVAFDPTQVKGAFNGGAFDPNNPGLLEQRAPTLTPAVKIDGKVYSGATHLDALAAYPNEDKRARQRAVMDGDNRGYVTEKGRFLDRFKAQDYARTWGLFRDDAPSWVSSASELASEYLKTPEEQAASFSRLTQAQGAPLGTYHPETATITLLKGANLSTFLHEAGHHYLEMLATFAAMPEAPQEVKDDWTTAARFIGAENITPEAWTEMDLEDRREAHETWARAFEAYLREGKAPSPKLAGIFQRFKAWLLQVYQSAKQLNVELNDEVRGVFDRLLASTADIDRMEQARNFTPVFATKPDSMTEQEWEAYQRLGEQATADAQSELAARSIRDMRWLSNQKARIVAELTRSARETRKAVRAEVTQELMAQPVNAAREFLKRGTISGTEWEGPHKLDKDAVAALYEGTPKEAQDFTKLGYGKYGMLASDGLDPDMVAELFGFSSGDELVEALLNAPDFKAEVEGLTDQRMLERYGDLTDADAIERAADEAVHNDARLRFVATEANALSKAAGRTKVLAEAARNYAQDLIGRQRIRDLKPSKYTGAEARAARQAAQAAAKGDLVTAAQEKRNQLINGYAAKAVFKAQADVDKALRYFSRLENSAAKTLDPEYREQIEALLERFDLRKGQSLKAIDRRTSLKAWIDGQRAKGLDPVISEELENEANRKHFRDLTVDELRGLVDAVRNIAHLGRLKHRLLVAAEKREFEATVRDVADEIRANAYQTKPPKLETNTWQDKMLSGFANYLAIHRKLSSIVREMAGLKDGTLIWKAFVKPMNDANDREAVMREQATIRLHEIFTPVVKAGGLRKKLFIPEIGTSLTLEGRLAVALNWGNELNRARIMDGDRWSAPQVQAILGTLTPEQLDFVNRVWEYLDSYWPEIAAKEKRVTGVEPEKVEPEPFQVRASDGTVVDMRGGYYPIKYDIERSSRSEGDEIAESVRATMQGAYTRATTRRGHTKARVDKVERPVRKDLSVPFQHVNQVIHDLAFHEYLIDANRLLGATDIDQAIRDHYGVETLRTMRNTLNAMAEGEVPAQDALERAVNYIRTGSTVAGLGWNLMTSLLQPLGLTQSIVRIGPKWVAKGLGRMLTDAATMQNTVQMIADKSDFMRLRAKTFMREINEVSNQVQDSIKPSAWGPVEQSFFWMIGKLQLIADVPTWLGQYEKATASGATESEAIALADQAVRDSQGAGQIGDLAQIQRGNAWFKLWTNFYSFFSIGYNQMAESVAATRRVGPARLPLLASDFLLVAILPAILGELLKSAVRGDDEDWEELPAKLAKAQVSYLLGFMVGLRELGAIVQADGKGVTGPAGLRLLTSDLPKLYQQIEQGEADEALRKAAINAAGVLLHFPAAQVNRTVDGFEALAKGETKNPMAVLFGPPRK